MFEIQGHRLLHKSAAGALEAANALEVLQNREFLPGRLVSLPKTPVLVLHSDEGQPTISFGLRVRGELFLLHSFDQVLVVGNQIHLANPEALEAACLGLRNDHDIEIGRVNIRDILKIRMNSDLGIEIIDSLSKSDILKHIPDNPKSENGSAKLLAKLYPYQSDGVAYMQFMSTQGVGVVLGDEMGLGKTLQAISFIADLELTPERFPALVVAPAILLENWRREFAKFTPSLKILKHSGQGRSFEPEQFNQIDVVLVSYDTAIRDEILLTNQKWSVVFLDEAQYLKNPQSARRSALKSLSFDFIVAITGTPFENHVTDIWSIFDLVLPNLLGSQSNFESQFSDDALSANNLRNVIEPFIIRRLVKDVASDLPEIIEISEYLDPGQPFLNREMEIIKSAGVKGIFGVLTSLRVFSGYAEQELSESDFRGTSKVERLLQILEECYKNNECVIVFGSFTNSLFRLKDWHKAVFPNVFVEIIDGNVPNEQRMKLLDQFATHSKGVLLINTKAGGVGLNITHANHVVHFNPEWNPALTDQATARAYRRGQTRPVTAHHFYLSNSVEELVAAKQNSKKEISAVLLGENGVSLTKEEILNWYSENRSESDDE